MEEAMQYALLAYASRRTDDGPIDDAIEQALAKPGVFGWIRLYGEGSATTVRADASRLLLTDGPFVESKEHLAGLILVEAEDLDGALAVAQELQELRTIGGIEVRPILEARFHGA
jgi:hypothetical protein